MRPLWFGPTDRPLFGWIHEGDGDVGVVVCNPFGFEAICAHRSLRHLASLGAPSIRFDYDGTGDSAGNDRDPDRVEAWIASIGHAIDALKRETGVARVVLVGVRLGALLAAAAAAGRPDVESVVLIAPVIAGKAFVREMRALQMALGLGTPGEEALGFVLTEETKYGLSKLQLRNMALPRTLLLDRADLPSGFEGAITKKTVRGYVEMVLDPHRAEVPREIVAAVAEWLGREVGNRGSSITGESTTQIEGVTERAFALDNGLFGILTTGESPSRRLLLLLNAGSIHHIGPNRLHVLFAREWAKSGSSVLRLDHAGIGDSPPRPGHDENVVYGATTIADTAAALETLRGRGLDVTAVGLCSGAFHAYATAAAGATFDEIVLINPLTFEKKPGMSLDYPAHRAVEDVERYRAGMLDPAKWKKLLRGEVHLAIAARALATRARGLANARLRDAARRVGRPFANDVGAALESIAKRGVRIRFVFAEGDPGHGLLRTEAGAALPGLVSRGEVKIVTIAGPDHTFTPVSSHAQLREVLGF